MEDVHRKILKVVFVNNSAADCPISVKFCVWKQFFADFQHHHHHHHHHCYYYYMTRVMVKK